LSLLSAGFDGPLVDGQTYTLVVTAWCCGLQGSYTLELTGAQLGQLLTDTNLKALVSQVALQAHRARTRGLGDVVKNSIGARLAQPVMTKVNSMGNAPALDTGSGVLSNGLHLWTEIGGSRAEIDSSADVNTNLWDLQVGIDTQIADDAVLGIALGAGSIESDGPLTSLEGSTYWIQPYLGFDFGAVRGVASVSYAYNDYDDYESLGLSGSASGDTISANLFLAHDFDYGDGLTVTPYGEIGGGSESIGSYGGGLSGADNDSIGFFDASAGAEVRYAIPNDALAVGSQSALKASAELQYFYTDAPSDPFGTVGYDGDGFGLGFGFGAETMFGSDAKASLTANVDGVGSDWFGYGATARLEIGF